MNINYISDGECAFLVLAPELTATGNFFCSNKIGLIFEKNNKLGIIALNLNRSIAK